MDHAAERTDRPRVGVVMAAYNGSRFIEQALGSLTSQTYPGWRCVVVDDGSTDATAELVEAAAARDDRISLVRQPNGGVSAARNVGLAALDPAIEYVALLDSDDWLEDSAFRSLLAALDARPEAVGAFGLAEYVDEFGRADRPGEHPRAQLDRRAVSGRLGMVDVDPDADSTFADVCVNAGIWPSAVALHRRAVIADVGGFDPEFRRQGDWDLYLRMSRHGSFAVLGQQVAWYRRHDDNLTGNNTESIYFRERVRHKAWRAGENTPAQRLTVARGDRRLRLADIQRSITLLVFDVRTRRLLAALRRAGALVAVLPAALSPRVPRASRRRVRWAERAQAAS